MGVTFFLGDLVVFGAESVFHPEIPLVPPEEHTMWRSKGHPASCKISCLGFFGKKHETPNGDGRIRGGKTVFETP